MTNIPKQLHNEDFRFVLLGKWDDIIKVEGKKDKQKGKIPFEKAWQKNGYKFDDPNLLNHIKKGLNFGVIGGYGDVRILDIDNEELGKAFEEKIETYTVKTGGGGKHFYFISDYDKNHVLVNELGELRANNYQVVSAPCKHPSGKYYEIIKDVPLAKISSAGMLKIIKPYLREETTTTVATGEEGKDTSRSGLEYRKIVALLREGKTKPQIFKEMKAYSKWESSPDQYKELTYDKALAFVEREKLDAEKPIESFLNYNEEGKPTGVSIDKVVEPLLEKFSFKTIFSTKSEIVYYYKRGIWNNNGREKIKTETEKLLGTWCRNNIVQEVVEKIKRKTAIDRKNFDEVPEGFICVENGILNLKTKEFTEHSPKYYFKTKIPTIYNTEAKCPNIEKFFSEVLYEEDIPLIQEWFGFNLYNKYFQKKAVILFGDTDTGKTVTLNLLSEFIGEENKIGLSLQKIAQNKSFDLMNLKNKYSNIYDDLSSKDLSDSGGFKIATGGGYITGEEKFGDIYSFLNFAKHTFATNTIPPIKDIDDDAYYSRWIPIAFDNKIDEKNQNKFLTKRLTTEEELSGLFNWAIEGLHRLIKNNRFSFKKTINEIKQIMQRSSHPLAAFAQDCLEQEDGNRITKEEMFNFYTGWCNHKKIARMGKEQLGRQLERFVPYIFAIKDKVRVWKNAKFKEGAKDTYQIDTSDTSKNIMSNYLKERKDKDNDNNRNIIYNKNKSVGSVINDVIPDSTGSKGVDDNDQKLISYPNNSDNLPKTESVINLPKKEFCGQDFEDLEIGEKFLCGQMWKNGKRLKCPKCSGDEKTGNLEDLKEKCVECGKIPAIFSEDSVKWYCEDCAELLLKGGR